MKSLTIRNITCLAVMVLVSAACNGPVSRQESTEAHEWLLEMTITQLQQGYRDGKFSVADVTSAYLDRINSIDRNGPSLNSIISINPDAIKIAEELDREITEGRIRGALHGVPVILKDNIDTKDKMPTTAGATALRSSFAARDSYIASKLRE
ncbi:MAG TPA: amidase family protein, partial [Bacteroidales bacterium]|nr:amidase family protein [Bacteroidales bacterium]